MRITNLATVLLMSAIMSVNDDAADAKEDAFDRWLQETGQSHLLEGSDPDSARASFTRLFQEWLSTEEGSDDLAKREEEITDRLGLRGEPEAPLVQVLDGEDAEEVAFLRSLYKDEDDKDRMIVTDERGCVVRLALYTYTQSKQSNIGSYLKCLSNLQHVRSASIGCDLGSPETRRPLPSDTLMPMAGWKQLESLVIDLEDMGAQALLNLASKNPLEKLREIDIRVEVNADLTLQGLRNASELRELEMYGNDLSDDGLRCLKNASKLEELTLIYTQVTGVGFDQLTFVETLKKATLEESPISDLGLQQLARCSQLEELYLGQSKVTDAGVKHLGKLNHLRDLSLSGTAITADGLEVLLDLKRLEALWIEDTQLGDEAIPILEKMKQLKRLWAKQGTKITPTGFDRLKKSLPDCDIVR